MKFIIEDCPFIYQVDWAMKNKVEDDTIEEYRPDLEESIEAFLELLENIFSKEKIAAYKYPSWTRWHPAPRVALCSRLKSWRWCGARCCGCICTRRAGAGIW